MSAYRCFGLLDVLIAEEKLAVEVAQVDGVEVNNVYLAESCEHQILEQLASDTSSSYHEHARLSSRQYIAIRLPSHLDWSYTCLMRVCNELPRLWRAYLSRPDAISNCRVHEAPRQVRDGEVKRRAA